MSIRPHRILGLALGIIGILTTETPLRAATWHSTFEAAKAEAQSSGRVILANFTGSDWCPACIQLRSSALNSPQFQAYADQKLVLLEVDFPRKSTQSAAQRQANEQLASRYGINAFPTLLLIGANGRALANVPAYPSAPHLIAALNQNVARIEGPDGPVTGSRPSGNSPGRPGALFGGAATQPLPTYTNLVVKSISGAPNRRFALVNSETMAVGDSAWFKLGGNRVQVHCVEIREKSVLVRVDRDEKPRELLLSDIRK